MQADLSNMVFEKSKNNVISKHDYIPLHVCTGNYKSCTVYSIFETSLRLILMIHSNIYYRLYMQITHLFTKLW